MSVLVFLVPAALALGLLGLAGFMWSLKTGQYEDLEGAAWRILEDDALQPGGCRVETEQSRIDASVETRMALALKQLFEQQRAQATNPPEADIQVDLESPDAP